MEALGGDQVRVMAVGLPLEWLVHSWFDRFLAQHAAVFYFWLLCMFYAFSPSVGSAMSCQPQYATLFQLKELTIKACHRHI
eukprot:scaffold667768_cov67-Prasinocladus_malaysianus.AAC.1